MAGHIYAQVNDSHYPNNTGAFSVSVTEASAVPLPAALPLFAGGLGVIALFARRKRRA